MMSEAMAFEVGRQINKMFVLKFKNYAVLLSYKSHWLTRSEELYSSKNLFTIIKILHGTSPISISSRDIFYNLIKSGCKCT